MLVDLELCIRVYDLLRPLRASSTVEKYVCVLHRKNLRERSMMPFLICIWQGYF